MIKYYLDEDISPKVAVSLRKQGIDTKSSHEVGLNGQSDIEQLNFASQEGRCLVTRNRDDFIELTLRFYNEQLPHCGILIVPHTLPADRFGLLARALAAYAKAHPQGPGVYGVGFLYRAT